MESLQDKVPSNWSANGQFILYNSTDPQTITDLWVLPLEGDRKPWVFLKTGFIERDGQFSPDGRWVAYGSNESGKFEVYVRPFPGLGAKRQISTAGGGEPQWRRDGKELFYLSLDNKIMAVSVNADSTFHAGSPVALFAVHPSSSFYGTSYDASPDGQKFLINSVSADQGSPPLSLMIHWPALLEKNGRDR